MKITVRSSGQEELFSRGFLLGGGGGGGGGGVKCIQTETFFAETSRLWNSQLTSLTNYPGKERGTIASCSDLA